MELTKDYAVFAAEKALELLAIDSPSGFTEQAAAWLIREYEALGYTAARSNKGAVLVSLAPGSKSSSEEKGPLVLASHVDTLGAMVAVIKENGRLKMTNIGGFIPANAETENVHIYTRDGRVYEGTIQLVNPSKHTNKDLIATERGYDTTEVVVDQPVSSAADVRSLGIEVGDYICAEARSRITDSGYIKSRFLDDKLSACVQLAFAKYLADAGVMPERKVYSLFTVYEEVGHGGAVIPADTEEMICVDMGCVGGDTACTERQVSICAKDSDGPSDYGVVSSLIEAAKREGADYCVDVYPFYASDVDMCLKAGHDVRHCCIGPGVYASHGYERSHIDGVFATLKLLKGYLRV